MSAEGLREEQFTWEGAEKLCLEVEASNLAAKALLAEVDALLFGPEPELADVVPIRAA